MRLLVLAVAVTSIATVTGSPSTYASVTPTCQGELATAVGSPTTATIVGTNGHDVIISNGSDVEARGGDDTICVSGGSLRVDGGEGHDSLRIYAVADATTLAGGTGTDTLSVVSSNGAAWTVDVPGQRISTESASATIVDFEHYRLGRASWSSLDFTGGAGRDILDLTGEVRPPRERPLTALLGDGDDALMLMPGQTGGSESVNGGHGHDAITMVRPGRQALGTVYGSLLQHLFSINGSTDTYFFGFEDVVARNFSRVSLQGDSADNVLRAYGCEASLYASAGDDVLRFTRSPHCRGSDPGGYVTAVGGPGNDRMVGSGNDDVLLGGDGRDVAWGGNGTDLCVAEARRACEK